jgi:hypothetical protein
LGSLRRHGIWTAGGRRKQRRNRVITSPFVTSPSNNSSTFSTHHELRFCFWPFSAAHKLLLLPLAFDFVEKKSLEFKLNESFHISLSSWHNHTHTHTNIPTNMVKGGSHLNLPNTPTHPLKLRIRHETLIEISKDFKIFLVTRAMSIDKFTSKSPWLRATSKSGKNQTLKQL